MLSCKKIFRFVQCKFWVNQHGYLKPWFVYVRLSLCTRFHKHIQGGIPNHSQLFVEVVHSVHLQSEQSLFNIAFIIQVP